MRYRKAYVIVAVWCMLLVPLARMASAQMMDKMDEMDAMDSMMMYVPPPETCKQMPSSIMVVSDTFGIQCRQVSGAAISDESVRMKGPLNAVDVWGVIDATGEVCFVGAGSITLLDTMYTPREVMSLDYSMKYGMTCAPITGPGTYVLLPGMMMDDMMTMDDTMTMDDMMTLDDTMTMDDMDDMQMDYAMMMDSMDTMVALEGCEVTALDYLNFRDEPGGEIIGAVRIDAIKTAIARTPNWFKVEHDGVEGWISSHYVQGDGDCE